jgi:hypothetical protein
VPFDADRLEIRGDPVPVPEPIAVSSVGAVNASISRDGTLAYVPGAGMNAALRSLAVGGPHGARGADRHAGRAVCRPPRIAGRQPDRGAP